MIAAAPALPSYHAIVPPRADRYIRFHGREILRVKGFLRIPADGRAPVIKCPDRHVVKPKDAIREGFLFCDHRPARGHAECGAMIYMLFMPGRDQSHRIWLADVTREEWREIERMGLDADGVLAYFGASFDR